MKRLCWNQQDRFGRSRRANKCVGRTVALPYVKRLSYDLASVCRKRFSPDMDFVLGKVSQLQLATLLKGRRILSRIKMIWMEFKRNKGPVSHFTDVCIMSKVFRMVHIYYDSSAHALREVQLGDQRLQLQHGMSGGNVNMFQVPLCLHVAGDKNHYQNGNGIQRISHPTNGSRYASAKIAASRVSPRIRRAPTPRV